MFYFYLLSAIVLLSVPVVQIVLHRKLADADSAVLPRLGKQNHALLFLAALAGVGLFYLVNPETDIRVDLLLAIPLGAVILLLWAMFTLRLWRLQGWSSDPQANR